MVPASHISGATITAQSAVGPSPVALSAAEKKLVALIVGYGGGGRRMASWVRNQIGSQAHALDSLTNSLADKLEVRGSDKLVGIGCQAIRLGLVQA